PPSAARPPTLTPPASQRAAVRRAGREFFRARRSDPDARGAVSPARSTERTTGRAPAILPNFGGSLPNDSFADVLGLRTIWIPHSYAGCSQHAPDEHLLASIAREGLGAMAGLFWDLGEPDLPPTAPLQASRGAGPLVNGAVMVSQLTGRLGIPTKHIVEGTQAFVRHPSPQTERFEHEPQVQSFIGGRVVPLVQELGLPWRRDPMGN